MWVGWVHYVMVRRAAGSSAPPIITSPANKDWARGGLDELGHERAFTNILDLRRSQHLSCSI